MTAHWIDPHRLNEAQRAELADLLPERLPAEQIQQFLAAASETLDEWEKTKPRTLVSDRRDRMVKVAAAARRLNQAIAGLDEDTLRTMKAHWMDEACFDPNHFDLGRWPHFDAWRQALEDSLNVIKDLADQTAAKYETSNQPQDRLNAKMLAGRIFANYASTFGHVPPKSDWFYRFMSKLGQVAGVTLGRQLVVTAINDTSKGDLPE